VSDLEQTIRDIVRDELAKHRAPANDDSHITVADYARRYSISERTVRDAIRDQRLEHQRIGRAVRITASAKIEPRTEHATARARLTLLGGKR